MTPEGFARLALDENAPLAASPDMTSHAIWDLTGEAIADAHKGKPTVGFGRNLADNPLTQAEALFLLNNDVAEIEARLIKNAPWMASIHPVWRDVIVMIDYNTGDVLAWRGMLTSMRASDTETAARCLLDSNAARELPERYNRMADAIKAKAWPDACLQIITE